MTGKPVTAVAELEAALRAIQEAETMALDAGKELPDLITAANAIERAIAKIEIVVVTLREAAQIGERP